MHTGARPIARQSVRGSVVPLEPPWWSVCLIFFSISARHEMQLRTDGLRSFEFLGERNNDRKPWLVSYHSCDVTLARQVFRKQDISGSNPFDRPISDLDFCLP